MKYLKKGEIIRSGDEYFDPYQKKWYPTKCFGKPVGIKNCTSLKYRRKK